MKQIFLKNKIRKNNEFQFYMHQFVESGINKGFLPLKEFKEVFLFRFLRKLCNKCSFVKNSHNDKKALIVASNGRSLYNSCFPYINYEIVPMLWDVWPRSWPILFNDLRRLNCKLVFVTVRQMAIKIRKELGIKAYWIPEGIDIRDYNKGASLERRSIQIYEMGRQFSKYHQIIMNLLDSKFIQTYKGNTYYDDENTLTKTLAFETSADLLAALPDIKIIVCFPQSVTHPDRAGGLESLTQRYWEAMLSRCIILGKGPQELIDLMGYNPVIEIEWNAPDEQLKDILQNIHDYQELVDRNYDKALELASWDNRWDLIKDILVENNYKIN